MNPNIIKAMAAKDFSLFFRNKFYAYMTVIGLIFYVGIYFLMPSTVDEELELGVYASEVPLSFQLLEQKEGFNLNYLESEEALVEAVNEGEYAGGIALPPDILEQLANGERPQVNLYFASDSPQELIDAITVMVEELMYLETGQIVNVWFNTEILGPDLLGEQIPLRDRMVPMLVVLVILMEMMGLSSLIISEVGGGTAAALLVTPMSVKELFTSKLIHKTVRKSIN